MKVTTLGEIAYKQLKSDILSGVYKPGERLKIKEVSERLDISMTPIKNTFMMLENEGLVKSIPHRGTFVTQLSKRDVIEYCRIRFSLESLAVDLICEQEEPVPPAKIKELYDLNEKIEKALHNREKKDFVLFDIQFHHLMTNLSGNLRLVEMLSMYPLSNFLVLMGANNLEEGVCEDVIEEHKQIIEALIVKDGEGMKRLLKENIFSPHMRLLADTAQ